MMITFSVREIKYLDVKNNKGTSNLSYAKKQTNIITKEKVKSRDWWGNKTKLIKGVGEKKSSRSELK